MKGFGPSSLISCGDAVWVSTKPDTGKSKDSKQDVIFKLTTSQTKLQLCYVNRK